MAYIDSKGQVIDRRGLLQAQWKGLYRFHNVLVLELIDDASSLARACVSGSCVATRHTGDNHTNYSRKQFVNNKAHYLLRFLSFLVSFNSSLGKEVSK